MNVKQLTEIISEADSLKIIAQAYGEIASIKLKRIREDVIRTTQFYDEISAIYQIVHKIASHKGVKQQIKTKKTISILLTSNYRFYGNINDRLIRYFIVNTTKLNTDRIIVGQTALDYFKVIQYFHPFETVVFKKDEPSDEELKHLITKIQDYEQVFVYYSKFKSVLVQDPVIKDVAEFQPKLSSESQDKGILDISQLLSMDPKNIFSEFILEPELGKMLQFFDSQIQSLIFRQTFLESELARTASRLIAMDTAQTNANKYIQDQKVMIGTAKKTIANNRLLETMASLSTWRKEND